jgi:hypothetical protein
MPDLDEWMREAGHRPPDGFAERLAVLAGAVPQRPAVNPGLRPWHWLSLLGGAGFGLLTFAEFLLFAFTAVGAH